jgi:HEAT repeat protein
MPREQLDQIAARAHRLSPADQDRTARLLAQRFAVETDPRVRKEIVHAWKALPVSTATAGLCTAVGDEEVAVRETACQALASHSGPEAVEALAAAVTSDPDIDVRLAAARALGNHRSPAAISALSAAVHDPDPALQYRVVQSLRSISDQDLGNNLAAWRQFARNASVSGPDAATKVAERQERDFR